MKTLLTIACILSGIILLHDAYNVYVKTHEINEIINIHVNNLKSKSVVGMYINTPHIKDPFEAVLEAFEHMFLIWFMLVAYTFISILEIIRLPFLFTRF